MHKSSLVSLISFQNIAQNTMASVLWQCALLILCITVVHGMPRSRSCSPMCSPSSELRLDQISLEVAVVAAAMPPDGDSVAQVVRLTVAYTGLQATHLPFSLRMLVRGIRGLMWLKLATARQDAEQSVSSISFNMSGYTG